jgi:hypothetical protein
VAPREQVYDTRSQPPETHVTTIERRIHLYRVAFERHAESGAWEAVETPRAIFEAIGALPASASASPNRYLDLPDGNLLLIDVDDLVPLVRARFAFKRTSGIPPIERRGHYRALRLQPGEGLAEIRHFVLDPGSGLLGIEVNGHSAGISRWAQYIEEIAPDLVTRVSPAMLIAGDIAETLRRIRRVRGASITVLRDRIGSLDDLDRDLAAGVRSLSAAADSLEISVAFEVGTRHRDAEIRLPWLDRLPRFLTTQESREAVTDAVVRAYDPLVLRTREIDLLEDRFVGRRGIQQLDDGSVVAASMYEAIEEVMRDLPASVAAETTR